MKPANVLTHAIGFQKKPISWRGFYKIGAELPILHSLRQVCGIGGPTRTEMFCSDLASTFAKIKNFDSVRDSNISSPASQTSPRPEKLN